MEQGLSDVAREPQAASIFKIVPSAAMATWASIANKSPQTPAEPSGIAATTQEKSCAVIDTNAIIDGSQLQLYGEQLATIPEVLAEVKDKKTRDFLERFPFKLQSMEPDSESLRAVMAFARDVGELQSLSGVDLKLIALTHSLERAAHGDIHLRNTAPTPKVHAKMHKSPGKLPGWGTEGADWDALDKEPEDRPTGEPEQSRVKADVQELHNSSAATDTADVDEGEALATKEAAREDRDAADVGDGEWEVVAKSHNAARRNKRKQARWANRAAAAAQRAAQADHTGEEAHHLEGTADGGDSEDWKTDDEGDVDGQAGKETSTLGSPHEGEVSDGEEISGEDEADHGEANPEEAGEAGAEDGAESRVCIVTGDYAMQNVALQMGLRLVAPDGKRIWQTRRWALRCSACFQICKETGRLFCSRCGNAALQKVEVVIGTDGTEQFGVRKKHIIRGTKFPLPKPHGGKNSKDPILREDVLLQRIPQLRSQAKKEGTDPFAPEFGIETWHQRHADLPAHVKAAAASLSVWKVRNPNERKHVRTNRRRK